MLEPVPEEEVEGGGHLVSSTVVALYRKMPGQGSTWKVLSSMVTLVRCFAVSLTEAAAERRDMRRVPTCSTWRDSELQNCSPCLMSVSGPYKQRYSIPFIQGLVSDTQWRQHVGKVCCPGQQH